ncbi:hypothetical protein LDENG_00121450 [Lucifuga dentata]|nr:hypothetical protein LDENG_00121450 [Lucifuga dentata]
MSGVVRLLVVTFLWTVSGARADTTVSCVFQESCILPCRFQEGAETIIHWIHATTDTAVHAYYQGQDQPAYQDKRFKGRTALYNNEISSGNASLLLRRVEVQDQGQYKCYTSTISTNQESFIHLKVQAPVSKVDIQQVSNRITCSSDLIYPEPTLVWSTSPESILSLNYTPSQVQKTQQELFNISSSLILSDQIGDSVYICVIGNPESSRRATVTYLPDISGSSDTDTVMPCSTSNSPLTDVILTWKFNYTETILSKEEHLQAEQWKKHVQEVSLSGSLKLKALSDKHSGIYTCEVRNAEGTFVTNTLLKIDTSQHSGSQSKGMALFEKMFKVQSFIKRRRRNTF